MSATNENSTLLRGKKKSKGVTIDVEDPTDMTEIDEQDKEKVNTRRNKDGWEKRKLCEVMLLEEIPETQRPNEPTHAVLEGELGKWDVDDQSNHVRNHALIHYIADLATRNDAVDIFDYEFVESLLRHGADINCMDPTGQTIFHEVARSWNTDVAMFLVEHGANINHQDEFGRSPLHVAAAVDYASMVEYIVQNGGDIHIKTKGEEQTALHYAAKNDAVNSIQMLLGYGANIDPRDCRNRTPLQIAAEMNRFKAAKLLVTEGAPAGVYDNLGNSALSLLIEKSPEVALIALDQLHTTDYINRREFYFLNYLEGAKLKEELRETPARAPLEIAVQNKRFDIIMHPVMRRLIAVKWNIYGKTGAILDLVLNLIYTILWTVEGVTVPKHGHELYLPVRENIWRFTIDGLLILFTLTEIKRQIIQTINTRRELVKWREWRAEQLQQDKQYCHPRWPQESKLLDSEIQAVKGLRLASMTDKWVYFDWICLFLILSTIATSMLFFRENTELWKKINNRTTIAMLLISWLRMFKYARPFENAGPFVVIFSNVVGDILKWFVLNAIIIIPFACAFWIEFGFNSTTPAEGYTDVSSLLYNIFQITIVGDYGWKELKGANENMARILCGSFILVAGIITLNLLIALVSNTFERHYENAVANAVMQRASTIVLLQSRMGPKKRKRYYEFIKTNASPQIVQAKYGGLMTACPEERATIERVYDDIRQIKSVLAERFGRRYGKGNKSDMEIVREDLGKVKRSGKELARDVKNVKLILRGRSDLCRMSGVPRGKKDDNDSDEETSKKNYNENKNYANSKNKNNNNDNKNSSKNNNNNNNNDNNNNNNDDDSNNPFTPNRPRTTRKRNRSRRSKKPDTSTSEASDFDDASITGLPETHFPKARDYQEAVYWPRRKKEPSNGHSKLKRAGGEDWQKGEYNQWSSYEHYGEPHLQYFSPRSERRYVEPQYGHHHSDHNSSVPLMYQTPPATPYYTDMSRQRRNLRGRLSLQPTQPPASVFQSPPEIQERHHTYGYSSRPNEYNDRHSRGRLSQPQEYMTQPDEFNDRLRGRLSPQPTQPPACVVQPPPGIQARRHTQEYSSQQSEYRTSRSQEYLSQPIDVSGQHGYGRLSRANVGQRSDQGSQYSDPDFHQPTERKQRGRAMTGSEARSSGGEVAEKQGEGEMWNQKQQESLSREMSEVHFSTTGEDGMRSENQDTKAEGESKC